MVTHEAALARMWVVPRDPSIVRMMRNRVSTRLSTWGISLTDDLDYSIRLAVSELVTNALLHDKSHTTLLTVSIAVSTERNEMLLVVKDGEAKAPACPPARVGELPENGRGLLLVSDIVSRWGIEPTTKGKRVWALIPLAGPPSAGERVGDQLQAKMRASAPRTRVRRVLALTPC